MSGLPRQLAQHELPPLDVLVKTLTSALDVQQADVGRARVGVFLCGPLLVKHTLRKMCEELNQSGGSRFVFHAEHF